MPNQETVQPGDLITAELINDLIDRVHQLEKLEARVQQLEEEGLLTWNKEIRPDQVVELHDAGIRNIEELSEAEISKVKQVFDGDRARAVEMINRARQQLRKDPVD